MEKDTRTEKTDTWKNLAEKAGNAIILHSWERMEQVNGQYPPEHKAYMALTVAIDEAIKAFIALDESLK